MSRHAIYDAVLGSLNLRQIRNTNLASGGQVINGVTSAGVLAQILGTRKDIRAIFETDDVAGVCAVSNLATAGLPIVASTITIPFQARQNLATFAAGASHFSIAGTNGLVIPTSFGVQDGGNATAGLECIFVSTDGDTAPASANTAQSLAAASFTALYGMGPIKITTGSGLGAVVTTLTRPTGFTVRPGITVRVEFNRGRNYVQEALIILPNTPVIEVGCYDLEDTVASLGGWSEITGLTAYFRKRTSTGWVPDATAEHISFSFADGLADVGSISGSGPGSDATKSYAFYGEALTIGSGVAIV